MIIKSIQLNHFRNYGTLELSFDQGTNLFYGDNAQGKTNILEAVFLCGTTRSHRQVKDRDMIRFGDEEAHIRMEMEKEGISYRLDMHLKKNRSKGIAINQVPIKRASELIGLCHFVFFSPEDLNMIKSGPSERRRFLDMQLCQLYSGYVGSLGSYNKVLMQRNRLLKDIPFHQDYEEMLDVWDEQLVRYGKEVIRSREHFVKQLNEKIGDIHLALSGGKEKLRVVYEKNTGEEEFAQSLLAGRERDLRMKMTLCGPHRDDLLFQTEEIDIRKFGSQGQQRTTALSLKLAEIELVREVSRDDPVLLLDDVLSELDGKRQAYLLDRISRVQTLVTCTGIEDFVENRFRIDRLFFVEKGAVRTGGIE